MCPHVAPPYRGTTSLHPALWRYTCGTPAPKRGSPINTTDPLSKTPAYVARYALDVLEGTPEHERVCESCGTPADLLFVACGEARDVSMFLCRAHRVDTHPGDGLSSVVYLR